MKRYFKSYILRSAKWGVQKGGKMNINLNELLGNQILVETAIIGVCMLVFMCIILNVVEEKHGFVHFLVSVLIAVAVATVRYRASEASPTIAAVAYGGMLLLYIFVYVLFFSTDRFWQVILLMVILLLFVPPTTAVAWKASLLWEDRALTTRVTALPLWLSALSILVFFFAGIGRAVARKKVTPAAETAPSVQPVRQTERERQMQAAQQQLQAAQLQMQTAETAQQQAQQQLQAAQQQMQAARQQMQAAQQQMQAARQQT